MRSRRVTPHIAIDGHLSKTGKPRKTAIDQRTLRHAGYVASRVNGKRRTVKMPHDDPDRRDRLHTKLTL